MLVLEVYNKAEWEIAGGNDDAEGRARKSESSKYLFLFLLRRVDYCSVEPRVAPVGAKDLALLTYIFLFYRAPNRATARIPVGRTYTKEIHPRNNWMECEVWTTGTRRCGFTSCGWLGIRRR